MGYYKNLLKASLKRSRNLKEYYDFHAFRAKTTIDYLKSYCSIKFEDKRVLDCGCGYGAYSLKILEDKPFNVFSLDIEEERVRNINSALNDKVKPVCGNAVILPFKDSAFDIILSIAAIEHIRDREKFVHELYRVLKKEGRLIISTNPFYSLIGGHALKPFHYLPLKLAIFLVKIFKGKSYAYEDCLKIRPPLTFKKFKSLIEQKGFKIIKLVDLLTYQNWIYKIFGFRELFGFHPCFIVKK